jgi:hypothetical protein
VPSDQGTVLPVASSRFFEAEERAVVRPAQFMTQCVTNWRGGVKGGCLLNGGGYFSAARTFWTGRPMTFS